MIETILKVDGMACGMCESHINDTVRNRFPVQKVTSSHTKGETVILSQEPLAELCQSYKCSAKVFTKPAGGLKNKLGSPDLMIFFTSTMSHKLVQSALSELKGTPTRIERCHTSSLSALRSILEKHAV